MIVRALVILSLWSMVSWGDATVSVAELHREWGMIPGEPVRLRGFLYQQDDGVWVLASRPNLRSCCVVKDDSYPVVVEGEGLRVSGGQVLELTGDLIVDLDAEPSGVSRFRLVNARIYGEAASGEFRWRSAAAWALCLVVAGVLFWVVRSRRRRRR